MDQISQTRLAEVYPGLAEAIRTLVATLPVECRVTQGLRTLEQQDALYAQGRSAPGLKVTNAQGGQSWHNFGCAVDLAPSLGNVGKYTPDWDVSHPIWKEIARKAKDLGLRSGVAWGDIPHLELTGAYGPKPPKTLLDLLKAEGLEAIWDKIFKLKGN